MMVVTMERKEVYTVREVAALTGFSRQTVMQMFEKKSGVIILERPERMHKRGYRSIRIPRHVYEHVLNGLKVK
jgi:predicted DNA-binding transcriptional regulator AlpA